MSDTWIATAAQMPEPYTQVMIAIADAPPSGLLFRDLAHYIDATKKWKCMDGVRIDADRVLYWLPLPSLPTASQEEGTNG
jgi:hypothetical protein